MLPNGYKDTEIGVIPVGWEVKYVKDIAKIITGKKDTQNKVEGGKYPFFVRSQTIERINSYSFDGEAVLTAGDGVGVGKIYHYLNEKFDYHQRVYNIHNFSDDVSGKYFFEYFKAKFYSRVSRMSAKNSVDSVRLDMIAKMEIPLPPLKEQEKIADILSTADNKIDAIATQIEKAETLKKGLLQKLLSEGIGHSEFKDSELGKIPLSWEVIPFLQLADTKISHSFTGGPFGSDLKSEHYTKDGVRVIQLQNIGDGSFINKDFVYTSEEKAEALKTCQIFPNDIILAKMAEPVARACIMPNIEEKYLMGSDGIRLHIDKSKYDTHFILHSINFNRFRDIAVARSTGTTRLRIGLTALKKIPIIIPPLEEQKQIAGILSTADEKLEVLRAKKEKYETLKKGLLQKLLSGEIRTV